MSAAFPSKERWDAIDQLFDAVLASRPDQREALLNEAARRDPELAREVRRLLEDVPSAELLLGESAAIFAAPLLAMAASAAGTEPGLAGTDLGAYRLVREIGHGGMGTVYLAERADAEFEKRVAVKVVKRGMDTDEVLRRFRVERQILANLDHPGIARLLDGGATSDGRPYLVMEYIEGRPLTAYCRDEGLSLERRLILFEAVCRAVQYAHQNLVVHRDLKPSNVLVTTEGEVKLLDFGIAKLLDPADEAGAPGTRTEGRLLTPEYASPEQHDGRPVTTASDVYALGVILHELLVGSRPRAGEPAVRPGSVAPPGIARQLKGDLDLICLKALEPEPERRYQSPAELAADIERHRLGRPIIARPATVGYRTRKYVQRHRTGVVAAALATVSLVALGIFYSVQVTRERDVAERERDKANRVVGFMTAMLSAADPLRKPDSVLTVRDVLARSEERLDTALADEPEVRQELWRVLGRTYRELGDNAGARQVLERAYREGLAVRGPRDTLVVAMAGELASVLQNLGRFDSAEALARDVLAARRERYGELHPSVAAAYNQLGELRWAAGDYAGAAEFISRSLELNRRLGASPSAIAFNLNNLGAVMRSQGRNADAEPVLREALELRRQEMGPRHPAVATTMLNLAAVLRDAGQYAVAESLFRGSLEMRREAFGPTHPELASALLGLALTQHARGNLAAAESSLTDALAIQRAALGPDHPGVGMTLHALGAVHESRADYAAAERLDGEAYALLERRLGPEHPNVLLVRGSLGAVLVRRGDARRGAEHLQAVVETSRRLHGDAAPRTVAANAELGWALVRLGQQAAGESLMVAAAAAWPPPVTPRDSAARQRLQDRLAQLDR